jgi:hypothetical protein
MERIGLHNSALVVVELIAIAAASVSLPLVAGAQPGKWVGTINQLSTIAGAADLTVESKGEKQSKAKIVFRNGKRDTRVAWDIVAGRCREEGAPIAPQATFAQVQTAMDGSGTGTATTPKLESGKLYYFRVFDPQEQASDASAFGCGNISEKL